MLAIGHPAARLHVRLIDAPECQFLLIQWSADIGRAMQFTGPVIVKDVGENGRMAVEKEFLMFVVPVEVTRRVGFGQTG
jgi:hypothetical protein